MLFCSQEIVTATETTIIAIYLQETTAKMAKFQAKEGNFVNTVPLVNYLAPRQCL
jgi:hypothetical protein